MLYRPDHNIMSEDAPIVKQPTREDLNDAEYKHSEYAASGYVAQGTHRGPRDIFIADVQKWAILDTQLKIVHEKTKKMRELKHTLTTKICDYIDTHGLRTTIGLNDDGELRIYEKREYSPLTYAYIQESLKSIIKNPEHIDYIIKYLKENREVKITKDIKRT